MNFNSLEYLIFLPTVFFLYWFVFKQIKSQNLLIVISSYLFYGLWDWRFLILIFTTSVVSYVCGVLLGKPNSNNRQRYWISCFNIVFNLLILVIFKYFNFFGESFSILLANIGIKVDWITTDIILPVGISFYTFQALSYTIDVYNRRIKATKDFIAFISFISFFPQLVAGPIERATNLLPQFTVSRHFNYATAINGMRLILLGLAKKMLVADNCASAVDAIFGNYEQLDGLTLLWGGVLFAFQIYGDFSGYSDIAKGSGHLLGINLSQNFKYPYFSRDIAEFWRRWHISLNTWFRDYIYIPLGGSRCEKYKVIRNIFVIFLLSGLWHGANWTFVCWGAYNAVLFIPLLLTKRNRDNMNTVAPNRILPKPTEFFQITITFFLIVIGWIIFRAENIEQAFDYIIRIFTSFKLCLPHYGHSAFLFIILLIIAEWIKRHKEHAFDFNNNGIMAYRGIRIAFYYILFISTLLFAGNKVEFIYFQF